MRWKSNARVESTPVEESYERELLLKNGTVFELDSKHLNLSIHKFVGCDDSLFLTCHDLGFVTYDLGTTDFDVAVKTAKELAKNKLADIVENVESFCNSKGKNTIVGW